MSENSSLFISETISIQTMANIVPVPTESFNLGFIGAGKMAESIARGVVKSGVLPASQIRTAHLGTARRTAFESFGVKVLNENSQVFSILGLFLSMWLCFFLLILLFCAALFMLLALVMINNLVTHMGTT